MTKKDVIQIPKITRKDDGIYSAILKIECTSKEELEEVFKRVEKSKKWTDENCKDNIGCGFRKGKIK
ncbi:hypothetical protein [uncultured Anaerococcus sp.]|uniref:hypothetical protein n=1 Tax=uncultured Anaerococcus sp. TaxID=293428 RepID=UPI00288B135A|nr:hypothetical protein [uncultured Anaerococcus sp.]